MKKLLLSLSLLATLPVLAQKQFDSAAYTNFNASRWRKVAFADLGKTVMKENLTAEEKLTGLAKC